MFRTNGMPRAQGCAGAASLRLAQHRIKNGTPRAQGCAGAVPLRFAQCLTQGRGETGNRSRGWPGPCAGAASLRLAQHRIMNGTPRAQGCAGAVPFSFARCLAQGGGESGNRSRGWPGPCAGAACVNFAQRIGMNGTPRAQG